MPTELISLDEASWRLELSGVSGRIFVEFLLTNEPVLLGLFPGKALYGPVDLMPVTRLRAEPGNVVVVDGVRWTDIKLNWTEFCAALEKRGQKVTWSWILDITPEFLERARQPVMDRTVLNAVLALKRRPPAVARLGVSDEEHNCPAACYRRASDRMGSDRAAQA